jgi:hypothetical protein
MTKRRDGRTIDEVRTGIEARGHSQSVCDVVREIAKEVEVSREPERGVGLVRCHLCPRSGRCDGLDRGDVGRGFAGAEGRVG